MKNLVLAVSLVLLATTAFAADGAHFILDPGKVLTDADRAELAARGISVQRPLTGGRYIVRVESAGGDRIATNAEEGLEPIAIEKKLHRSAIRMAARAAAGPAVRVRVMFHEDVAFDDARNAIAAAGATIEDPLAYRFGVMQQVTALVSPEQLTALAADDRVLVIAGAPRMKIRADNATTAAVSHVTEVHAAPYGLTGDGVIVSLYEPAAAQTTHPEFEGRLSLVDITANSGSSSDQSHATHVAGTIGAAGIQANAKGMAPKVRIFQFRANGDPDVLMPSKDEKLPPTGSRADNNSWGYVLGWDLEGGNWVWNDLAEYYGAYDLVFTAPLDQISRERGILFVHSAGNDADVPVLADWSPHRHTDNSGDTITDKTFCYSKNGSRTDCPVATCSAGTLYCETAPHLPGAPYDTIGLTAAAKNVVSVGAVDSNRFITGFSSRGPAKDGRVKPDVVARGQSVLSTSNNSSYTNKNGTSMSSPAVTGIVALLIEQWRRLFGPDPTPAELKGLLIAGADDLGTAGPDYSFGFGLVNAKASVDLIRADAGNRTQIHKQSLAQGQTYEARVAVSTAQTLRAVLQWADPEIVFLGGDEVAEKALVNDLDVKVIDGSGNETLAYVLNPGNIQVAATRGTNTIDNTEMVEVPNAAPGVYTIRVTATRISDQSPQEFALIANAAAVPPCNDRNEPNDSAGGAYGNLVSTQSVNAALCTSGDIDFFKFTATKQGGVSVAVTATGDTALTATLRSGGAVVGTVEIPAGQSRTISTQLSAATGSYEVEVRPSGTVGVMPTYTVVPTFGQSAGTRQRVVRR